MIKYIGSKRLLANLIGDVALNLPITSVCDLFSGTTRVGQALRRRGLRVLSNDTASYSYQLGLAYIVADGAVDRRRLRQYLHELNQLPGAPGYFTRTFCEDARYFQPKNGARIEVIRQRIDELAATETERGLLLASLLEAADRVDSTCGLQMAFLKSWAPRASNDLELREPKAVAGPAGEVVQLDANALAPSLDAIDCTYVDPPYNQHSYFSNYHVWETLIRGDAPATYGIAQKRIDCRTAKSRYNSKRQAPGALKNLLASVASPWFLVSFNNEGFHDLGEVSALLAERGYVNSLAVDFKRYVGAQIGIHNLRGEKVGTVSHLRNLEVLFVVGPDRDVIAGAFDHLGQEHGQLSLV